MTQHFNITRIGRMLLYLILVLSGTGLTAQVHFVNVWSGNGVDHMNFYITKATIEGENMQAGDEIGIFDGEYCVGACVLTGEVIEGINYLSVVASKNDATPPGVNGYTPGNSIIVKLWDDSELIEISEVDATYISGSAIFSIGGTSSLQVEGTSSGTVLPVADAGDDLQVNEGDPVELDGSGSYDPLEGTLTFLWTTSSAIVLDDPASSNPGFTAPEIEENTTYEFYLVVNNGTADSEEDTVVTTVLNVNDQPYFTVFPSDTAIDRNSATIFVIKAEDADPADILSFSVAFDPTINQFDVTETGNGEIELSVTPDNADPSPVDVIVSLTDNIIADPVEQTFTLNFNSTGIQDPEVVNALSIRSGPIGGHFSLRNNLMEELDIEVIHLSGSIRHITRLQSGQEIEISFISQEPGLYFIRYTGASISETIKLFLEPVK